VTGARTYAVFVRHTGSGRATLLKGRRVVASSVAGAIRRLQDADRAGGNAPRDYKVRAIGRAANV